MIRTLYLFALVPFVVCAAAPARSQQPVAKPSTTLAPPDTLRASPSAHRPAPGPVSPSFRLIAPPSVAQIQVAPRTAGASLDELVRGTNLPGGNGGEEGRRSLRPAAPLTAEVKARLLSEALHIDIPPQGLAMPVRLTPRGPYAAGTAFVSAFLADVNTGGDFFGLNGRAQERLVVGFRPAEAGKPVLMTIGIAQAAPATSATLTVRGSGVEQLSSLSTYPAYVHAVVTPADTNWYRVEISGGPFVAISYVELTPQR